MADTANEPRRSTQIDRSDRELTVTRIFDAPRHLVFRAWSEAELFRRWWVPEGAGIDLVACEMDVRTGGGYKLEFAFGDAGTMAFYGSYLSVVPDEKIVWTNEEEANGAVTTVTFSDSAGGTLVTFHETYPTKAALDDAMEGSAAGLPTQLDQLDRLLSTLS